MWDLRKPDIQSVSHLTGNFFLKNQYPDFWILTLIVSWRREAKVLFESTFPCSLLQTSGMEI